MLIGNKNYLPNFTWYKQCINILQIVIVIWNAQAI